MNDAYKIVTLSRSVNRPIATDYINYIFEDFIEFHGDRYFGDDSAIVSGIAQLNGIAVTIIGIQKGTTLEENIYRNFGQVKPEGYRKALRMMKQAEKFNRPIICFINTSGAFCGIDAENRGQGEAIARNLFEMGTLKVPIISIMTGEGGSGGALALAVADTVWALKNSTYSVLSPEGFASILWKDSKRAEEAAEFMKLTSDELLKLKVVDKVIDEDKNGIENKFYYTADSIRKNLLEELDILQSKSIEELLKNRYNRFKQYGEYFQLD